MIDIDFFKKYNDTYGHLEGDNCLKKMATAMNTTVRRPADMFARFGGEEFVALLPDTDEAGAVSIAVSMKEKVARLALQHEGSDISNCVTFSMGIALMIPDRNTISDELVNRADKALYQAKHLGRNRFVIYG